MFDIYKINLQLFAELNTNVTGDAALSVENKTFYDMNLSVSHPFSSIALL